MPESLVNDKQAAKEFFGQFGVIKRFIMRPKRNECTVEYEKVEAAQRAQNYEGEIKIFATQRTPEPDYIDPDVQSELDLMYPVSSRPQPKSG